MYESYLDSIIWTKYLHDVVVYGYDFGFRYYNLKLIPIKCNFLRYELHFFGNIVTDRVIKPDPKMISAILN